jgi:hypothetical protein
MLWSTAEDNQEYSRSWAVLEVSDGGGEKLL